MTTEHTSASGPHIPVLLRPLLKAVAPVTGRWLDGTFGAGGYTRALLEAGADQVIAVDRDPLAFEMAKPWAGEYGDRLVQQQGVFSRMDEYAQDLDGVVLDLGVSSMQLDLAERGFSFMKDGPLDMRMSQEGPSAADLVAELSEAELADILFYYGEERASRRIARAIVKAREVEPITTTLQLASLVESCLPRAKPGQSHPATRSFQALRIAVNAEYDELFEGLLAAERALKPGGLLAVVTFHSVEDRMVKRFFQHRAGKTGRANRYAPEIEELPAQFEIVTRKAVGPDDQELAENPRSRSARLRVGRRTDAAPAPISARDLGMPQLKEARK
ncbi:MULTISPECIES: 16S rRNA (cytosine(1402)-N(4))-methyltransferase RsmH [Rhodobacterales]|jgi:16S rRNA (cytosine1402-N4)-methyltransferase|uniref:16S rRNA (cytosine(1402)-N(4))-methyltransferase RsmH n=1 Tax=Rhodobacterales TaxID=204455 RepID=UPI00237FB565|nr:16S rRNA (cytosine(1402)-N(4))-methyltransferase RsmH [Phaeobacter gallaeciensis]MDE4138755.1 16S rRNA (cytosine(1402)-N(4))-methyltransferase RsmH [Phaeobacter gallaeciensis]MDE4148187.1 16S rRNA (cytosine(1402)-N(4))-methyltransferase RsmH [Phaeobacter gallaeciensis]MDE4152405.1 16S rRNA (cytosine(1402)-N(4))-methyltransferase RsmH [Phaeobacter gallaeciensis]MDE4226811.1 16S rRNA (cytosine(1402)-N(4))-methyltransferase RsmH [Phaeobacter gallaeciensis]MDE4256869.1 16S rRNA (cytosine(1402)-